jgi:hypothetical protein
MPDSASVFKLNFKALSLFRLALSAYLLADFLSFKCCFEDFYDQADVKGVVFSADAIGPDLVIRLFLTLLEFVGLPTIFPLLYPIAIVVFGVGYRTRWSNAAVLALHVYFISRTPLIIYGADLLADLMLLWCLFLPMSRYWAIDAALDSAAKDRPYPPLPFAAIMLQASSIYVFPALIKLAGTPWRDGYAVIWALSDNMFGGTPVGSVLVHTVPDLLIYANYLTIAFQLVFPLLVLFPWHNDLMRVVALLGAVAIQVSFILCLNIGAFPYISLAILLLYVPDAWLDRLSNSRRGRFERLSIYYEPDCNFCLKIVLLFREFLLDPAVPVLPASADPEMLRLLKDKQTWIVRADNVNYLKWHGVAYLLRQRYLTAPLAWLMETRFLRRPMDRFYDLIGRNRRRQSTISGTFLPFRTDSGIGRVGVALCGFLTALAFCSNVNSIVRISDHDASQTSYLDAIDSLARILQVSQHWYLFAPVPSHFQKKFEIIARYNDGSARDLADILPRPPFRARLDGIGFDFAHHRWLKYLSQLQDFSEHEWQAIGVHLCRQIKEQSRPPMNAPHSIEITLSTKTIERGVADGPATVSLRSIDCAA